MERATAFKHTVSQRINCLRNLQLRERSTILECFLAYNPQSLSFHRHIFQRYAIFKDAVTNTFHPVWNYQRCDLPAVFKASVFQTHTIKSAGIIYLYGRRIGRHTYSCHPAFLFRIQQIENIIYCTILTSILSNKPGNQNRIIVFPCLIIFQINFSVFTGRNVHMHPALFFLI